MKAARRVRDCLPEPPTPMRSALPQGHGPTPRERWEEYSRPTVARDDYASRWWRWGWSVPRDRGKKNKHPPRASWGHIPWKGSQPGGGEGGGLWAVDSYDPEDPDEVVEGHVERHQRHPWGRTVVFLQDRRRTPPLHGRCERGSVCGGIFRGLGLRRVKACFFGPRVSVL